MRNKKLLFVNLGILFALMVVVIIGVSRMNATTEEEQPAVSKSKPEYPSTQISGLSQLSKKVVFSGKEIYKPRNLLEQGDNGSFVLTSGNVGEASTEGNEVEVPTDTHNSNLDQSEQQVTFVANHSSSSSNESNRSGSNNKVEKTTSSPSNAEKKDKGTKPKNNDSDAGTDDKDKTDKGENPDKGNEKPKDEQDAGNKPSDPNNPPEEDSEVEEGEDPNPVEDPSEGNKPDDGEGDPNPGPQTSK